MKGRWITLGAAIGLGVALVVGFGLSSGAATALHGTNTYVGSSSGATWATCDAMHDSPAMRQIHAQMPADLQARCDAMHEQMQQIMGTGGMMGAGWTMDGVTSSHAAHHAIGSVPPNGFGGMMGASGSGGMMGS